MGCNCARAKQQEIQNSRSTKLLEGSIETVDCDTLKVRRDACRACPYSTKNLSPKYAKFGGLTSMTNCEKSNRLILECLKDPLYKCPDNRFK